MGDRGRIVIAVTGIVGIVVMLASAAFRMPAAGSNASVYGITLNAGVIEERHVTDVVTAINFDYRGFDTLGEEFILFASVMGVQMLLRDTSFTGGDGGADDDKAPSRRPPRTSPAVRVLGVGLVGLTVLFGLYVLLHGALTPGGGFQAGVILATAPLLVYLAAEPDRFGRISPRMWTEIGEACGACGYVLIGALGVVHGTYLQNVLPLGPHAQITSGGTIPWINAATGLEVSAGIVLLLATFLEEALQRRLEETS